MNPRAYELKRSRAASSSTFLSVTGVISSLSHNLVSDGSVRLAVQWHWHA